MTPPARRVSRFRESPLPQRDGLDAVRVVMRPEDVGVPVVDVLRARFPAMAAPEAKDMAERFAHGDFVDQHGDPWGPTDTAVRSREIYFYRELANEPMEPVEIPVIFENEHLLVVDKPHDMASIPRGEHVRRSALVRLRVAYNSPYLSPIHRLDKQTAGVLVLSKVPEERGVYQGLFADRAVRKSYLAVVKQDPANTVRAEAARAQLHAGRVEVEIPIAKEHGDMWAHADYDGSRGGKTACTTVRLLREEGTWGGRTAERMAEDTWRALVHLTPHTGRTHQLRVHMDTLGLPIEGDELYPAPAPDPYTGERTRSTPTGASLQLLSHTLEFTDPITGQQHVFESQRELSVARPHSRAAYERGQA